MRTKGGACDHIASGDHQEVGDPGAFGAIGEEDERAEYCWVGSGGGGRGVEECEEHED